MKVAALRTLSYTLKTVGEVRRISLCFNLVKKSTFFNQELRWTGMSQGVLILIIPCAGSI